VISLLDDFVERADTLAMVPYSTEFTDLGLCEYLPDVEAIKVSYAFVSDFGLLFEHLILLTTFG
jgi:hypothetical protein